MESHSFALEQLEGRALFCAVAPIDAAPMTVTSAQFATPQATIAIPKPFPNAFNVAGTFTHPFGNPDAGSTYLFTGTGKTNVLGAFTLTGKVQGPGLIANARASGKLTITTPKGTIHLSVTGPLQSPGSLPPSVSFSIYRGTGAFVNSKGKGKITLSVSGTTHKFLFRFIPKS
jgi:hypothetical protein